MTEQPAAFPVKAKAEAEVQPLRQGKEPTDQCYSHTHFKKKIKQEQLPPHDALIQENKIPYLVSM